MVGMVALARLLDQLALLLVQLGDLVGLLLFDQGDEFVLHGYDSVSGS